MPAWSGPTAPPPKKSHAGLVAGVVVVVVVVALVLALGLMNILPIPYLSSSKGSSSSSSSGDMTFAQARPYADSASSGYGGGGWSLILAFGFGSTTSTSVPSNLSGSSGSSSGCNVTILSGASTTVGIPAMTSSVSSGAASAWVFGYRNGSGALLLTDVINGKGTNVATIAAGQSCSTGLGLLSSVPSTVIDSSQVTAAVATDAAGFLKAHLNASVEFELIGGINFFIHISPEWTVRYTTCTVGFTSSSSLGDTFNATVNATSGKVIYWQNQTNVPCNGSSSSSPPPPSPPALNSNIQFSTVTSTIGPNGTYNYTATVSYTGSSPVYFQNCTFLVTDPNGSFATVNSSWSLSVVSNFHVIGSYDLMTNTWTMGMGMQFAAGMDLVLHTPVDMSGGMISMSAMGFTGNVAMFL